MNFRKYVEDSKNYPMMQSIKIVHRWVARLILKGNSGSPSNGRQHQDSVTTSVGQSETKGGSRGCGGGSGGSSGDASAGASQSRSTSGSGSQRDGGGDRWIGSPDKFWFRLSYSWKVNSLRDYACLCASSARSGGRSNRARAGDSFTNREDRGLSVNLVYVSDVDSLNGIGATTGERFRNQSSYSDLMHEHTQQQQSDTAE